MEEISFHLFFPLHVAFSIEEWRIHSDQVVSIFLNIFPILETNFPFPFCISVRQRSREALAAREERFGQQVPQQYYEAPRHQRQLYNYINLVAQVQVQLQDLDPAQLQAQLEAQE